MKLIDADALVEAVKDYPYGIRGMIVCDIVKQPTIDPVRHGRWIDTGSGTECSVCMEIQYGYDSNRNYCPNCGAKMDGGKTE